MKIKELISEIDNITFQEAVDFVLNNAKMDKKSYVVTINTELIMHARLDRDYEKILKSADLLVNDSIGIKWARRVFDLPSNERVHGIDLFDGIVKKASEANLSIGLLGAGPGVAKKTADNLVETNKDLKLAFVIEEWPDDSKKLICDILFVAFGSPKQEKWIYENLGDLNIKVTIGVGGAFDFVSGEVRRAPIWVQKIGLEWIFRLIIQPWRIKRQIKLAEFVLLVIREKLLG